MPPYQWTSTEPGPNNRDTREEDTKGIKGASWRLENGEGCKFTSLLIDAPHQEEHASNVDRWATLPETAQGRKSKRTSISSTTMTRNQSAFHLPLYQGIMWPR